MEHYSDDILLEGKAIDDLSKDLDAATDVKEEQAALDAFAARLTTAYTAANGHPPGVPIRFRK